MLCQACTTLLRGVFYAFCGGKRLKDLHLDVCVAQRGDLNSEYLPMGPPVVREEMPDVVIIYGYVQIARCHRGQRRHGRSKHARPRVWISATAPASQGRKVRGVLRGRLQRLVDRRDQSSG